MSEADAGPRSAGLGGLSGGLIGLVDALPGRQCRSVVLTPGGPAVLPLAANQSCELLPTSRLIFHSFTGIQENKDEDLSGK